MLVKSAFIRLLKPSLTYTYFCIYYPPRKPGTSKRVYYRNRKRAYKSWMKRWSNYDEDE